ncbi:renin receptor [Ciona intestinalis]
MRTFTFTHYGNIAWIFCLGLISTINGQLYIVSKPDSIQISSEENKINGYDVPQIINYMMGFSSDMSTQLQGLVKYDIFNSPSANLLINIDLPTDVSFTLTDFAVKYDKVSMEDDGVTSMDQLNKAITALPWKQQPVIVDLVTDSGSTRSPMFNGLAFTNEDMMHRLALDDSLVKSFSTCLNPTNVIDQSFYAEIQLMQDILDKIKAHPEICVDGTPDSYNFILTSLENLKQVYGVDSCQVKSAITILEAFIPKFVKEFKDLYNNNMVVEVNMVVAPHTFNARYTRAVDDDTNINGTVVPTSTQYSAMLNIGIWFTVFFVLAVYFAVYVIWVMDPGSDSLIYRMATQRIKNE